MNIIGQMLQPDYFSFTEQSVIEMILDHPEMVEKATVKELGDVTFTSASTIVRLYQKLGCKNYGEFKAHFFSSLATYKRSQSKINENYPFSQEDSFQDITNNLGILCENAISETLSLMNENKYQKAVTLLYEADVIDVYGVGTNQSLAMDFKMNLQRINKVVNVPFDHQQLILNAAYSTPKHVALIISYTGETLETLEYCNILKGTGTPMICITSIGNNSIADLCNLSLNILSKEKMFSKIGMFSSKYSIILILDILYSSIFSKDYENNIKVSHEKRQITTRFRSNAPTLKEES